MVLAVISIIVFIDISVLWYMFQMKRIREIAVMIQVKSQVMVMRVVMEESQLKMKKVRVTLIMTMLLKVLSI